LGWEGFEKNRRYSVKLIDMCGIHGFNFEDEGLIHKMIQKTAYRGPDDSGFHVKSGWSLGHNRLSIIDLSKAGHQPMHTTDGKFSIVFNGEIYNFEEIKKELLNLGYRFNSKTDTEVILYAFKEWGRICVKKFNGMFAFAIIDNMNGELFIARDHIGIKPLYYYYKDGRFIFSSEAKALFLHDISKEISRDSLNVYFRFLYVPAPFTIWKHVKKLEPGHSIQVKNGQVKIERFWNYSSQGLLSDKNEILFRTKNLIKDSVKLQLVADRPVGIYLSGGIDSTIITGVASSLSPHIQTFSVGFEETEEEDKYNNDMKVARETAKYFGTTHNEYRLKAEDVITGYPRSIYHMDEPISNHVQTVNMLLAERVKEKVTVVLGGDGGDELFGGYERYYYSSLIDYFQKLPKVFQKSVLLFAKEDWQRKLQTLPGIDRYLEFFSQKEESIGAFLKKEYNDPLSARSMFQHLYFDNTNAGDFTREFMRTDVCSWLPSESLARSDKMSMAVGVEQRVPFLDIRLVELADKIPVHMKLGSKGLGMFSIGRKYEGKMILKEAMKEYVPDFVLKQPKWGWFSPAAKWLRGPMKSFAEEVLSPSYNKGTKEMFDFNVIEQILRDHISKKKYALNTLWSLITFQVWYRQFMEK